MKRIVVLFILFVLLALYETKGAAFLLPPQSAHAQQTEKNLSVTAVVPPQSANYQFEFTADNTALPVRQDTRITYTITYGVDESAGFNVPITLVAEWGASDAMTNVPVLNYIPGSATTAYGEINPIVDLTDRTITWQIPSLPAGTTDQKVYFTLTTNSNYTGSNEIPFTVRANMSNQYVAMDEQEVRKNYRFDREYRPPSTTTPTPTPPPPPATTPASQAQITGASFTTVTDGEATLLIDTTVPITARVMYGTSSRSLPSSLTTAQFSRRTSINLDNLRPNTTYYLRVVLTDESGSTRTSEIFTFRTAENSTPPVLEENIIVLTSGGNILVSDVQRDNAASQVALLTPESEYEFTYAVKKNLKLRSIDAVVRSKVLGITNKVYAESPPTVTIPMRERSPSVYVASLRTLSPGSFDVSVRILDVNGNITEQKIAEIKVIPHLSVLDEDSNEPISESRVFFSMYNEVTNRYESLPAELFKNIPNPSYTDITGLIRVTLPQGKYQAHVSAFGYDEKTVTFTLGTRNGEEFPEVLLRKNPINLVNYLQYYSAALGDIFSNIQTVVSNLVFSVRFFNLLATFVLFVTIGITFVLFSLRTRVHFSHLLPFFTHHIKTITRQHPLGTFCATITDEDGRRIKDALISVLDDTTGELLTSIASNTVGICYLLNPKEHKNLKLLIIKQGYQPKTVAVESDIADTPNGLTIVLKKGHKPANPALANTWHLLETIAGRFFELSLFMSFILELFFFSVYGWSKTLPFFILSFFNLILWILYEKEKQERKVFRKE